MMHMASRGCGGGTSILDTTMFRERVTCPACLERLGRVQANDERLKKAARILLKTNGWVPASDAARILDRDYGQVLFACRALDLPQDTHTGIMVWMVDVGGLDRIENYLSEWR